MINSIIKENIKGEIISILYIIIVFILSVPLYKINPEFSRKEIHIMLGNFYFIALLYFTNWYFASFFPFLSIFLNYLIIKYKAIKYMIRVKKKDRIKFNYFNIIFLENRKARNRYLPFSLYGLWKWLSLRFWSYY